MKKKDWLEIEEKRLVGKDWLKRLTKRLIEKIGWRLIGKRLVGDWLEIAGIQSFINLETNLSSIWKSIFHQSFINLETNLSSI
ncbi:MAG: hypothetical protein AUJ98_08605 [Bacteroidetes bacterium CG2_30_33_31]|nr:MAG: hypothetical protein AUJ98_08605 [Bacteroidetes bacterium CG2_30_33_31]